MERSGTKQSTGVSSLDARIAVQRVFQLNARMAPEQGAGASEPWYSPGDSPPAVDLALQPRNRQQKKLFEKTRGNNARVGAGLFSAPNSRKRNLLLP